MKGGSDSTIFPMDIRQLSDKKSSPLVVSFIFLEDVCNSQSPITIQFTQVYNLTPFCICPLHLHSLIYLRTNERFMVMIKMIVKTGQVYFHFFIIH